MASFSPGKELKTGLLAKPVFLKLSTSSGYQL